MFLQVTYVTVSLLTYHLYCT